MIEKTFAKGNYNEWEKFIKETLPQRSELFRSKLIPAIDETLKNMGFTVKETMDLFKLFGKKILDIINDNIYELVEYVSFKKLDT